MSYYASSMPEKSMTKKRFMISPSFDQAKLRIIYSLLITAIENLMRLREATIQNLNTNK
jgi:hypothetical protein